MNKVSIATALLLAFAAAGASAAPGDEELPGPYLGAAVGASHYKFNFDCADGADSCDKSPNGFKFFGGLPMTKYVALELQYIQYGKAEAKNGGATLSGEGRHFGLGVAATKNFGNRLTGTARGGLASNKFKISGGFGGQGSAYSENKVSYYMGGSFGFRVTPNLTVEGGLDMTRFEFLGTHATARMLSLGVRNAF